MRVSHLIATIALVGSTALAEPAPCSCNGLASNFPGVSLVRYEADSYQFLGRWFAGADLSRMNQAAAECQRAFNQDVIEGLCEAPPTQSTGACTCNGLPGNYPGYWLVRTNPSGQWSVLQQFFAGNPPTQDSLEKSRHDCNDALTQATADGVCPAVSSMR